MKSSIWRMAGVGLLCVSVSAPLLAENQGEEPHPQQHNNGGGQHGGGESHQGNNQPRPQNNEPRPQGGNGQPFEHNGHNQGGGNGQGRPPQAPNNGQGQNRPAPPPPANNLPIQGRPDTVRQTQEPQHGYYQDVPRRNDYNGHGQGNYQGPRPTHDQQWPGRPNGHGNGWGPGPQYRPGYVIDRFPDRNFRVPYRGQDYFFSGGYWYRPQGPRYVVVRPPYGIRVGYLPDYAQEVWIGGALLFLAAGAYYSYQPDTQDYVVVPQPGGVPAPQPVSNSYDVVAYPANGQSPQQVAQDGNDCYRWAVQQSGFDPRTAPYQPAPQVVQTYRQAQGNCLSSRGYQVTY